MKKETANEQKERPNAPPTNSELEEGAVMPFDPEDIRLKFEEANEERISKEKIKNRRKLFLGAFITLIICLSITLVTIRVWTVIQERQLAITASLTAEALANKYQSAENLMLTGKPEEALILYNEIKQVDPSYKDVNQKIDSAEKYIEAITLYEQGVQLMNTGKYSDALETFSMVEQLYPDYKNTRELIQKIEQDKEVAFLIKEIEKTYAEEDWEGVIHNYEAIQAIDPFMELPELKDILFNSYRNLIIALASRPNLTLEEIETADDYYRKAIALVPQDKDYAEEREELKAIAIERLANKYYLYALSLIESSDYSYKGLRESVRILKKADNIGSESPIIMAEIEKAELFLTSYDDLLENNWDDAISKLETLLRKDENYADGRAKYFLYEAYTARGDNLFAYADFEGAFVDYQKAELIAWSDKENILRLFQIQVRIAAILKILDEINESAEYYNYAFERLDYEGKLTDPDEQEVLKIIAEANKSFQQGDAVEAINLYETAMEQQEKIYDQTTILVKQDDTLLNIAFVQGSTLERLRAANNIGESMVISIDQELLVSLLRATGQ
jgi:tetratricopeptide (TPR) repeat protein